MFDVEVPAKRRGKPPTVVAEDEEYKNVNPEKFKKLATVFQVLIQRCIFLLFSHIFSLFLTDHFAHSFTIFPKLQ